MGTLLGLQYHSLPKADTQTEMQLLRIFRSEAPETHGILNSVQTITEVIPTPFPKKSQQYKWLCFLKDLAVPEEDSVMVRTGVTGTTSTLFHKLPQQLLSKDTRFLPSIPSNTSADLNASVEAGRREHSLKAYYVPGTLLVILIPFAFHIVSSLLISSFHPSIHLRGRRDSRYDNW